MSFTHSVDSAKWIEDKSLRGMRMSGAKPSYIYDNLILTSYTHELLGLLQGSSLGGIAQRYK